MQRIAVRITAGFHWYGRCTTLEGKLTNANWATIGKCSADTALRDINDLLARGVLRKLEGGGRSTGYELVVK